VDIACPFARLLTEGPALGLRGPHRSSLRLMAFWRRRSSKNAAPADATVALFSEHALRTLDRRLHDEVVGVHLERPSRLHNLDHVLLRHVQDDAECALVVHRRTLLKTLARSPYL
jgi:hypothetical protein